ncbi:FAD-binding oxidoreductase [uncultured Clostridium sp.]|uniref:FAD-binding oxidoreductase n=1 Tax=uncultured Clostridium sp. TaxID=59620 RepID=UPI0025E35A3B|nr:FAD-binding oxidoreductase [uncultured Clostridium sp.]
MSNKNWDGFKELVLVDKTEVCPDIISFYFKSKDGSKLVKHKAGQFLPFKIKTDDPKYKDVIRTYSLSMFPNEDTYRISVKKINGGLISTYLHENLNIGDSIEAMVPTGLFTINNKNNDIVLISGGIGITPLLSMLYEESSIRNNIHFIQAVQNSKIHPFKDDIENIAKLKNIENTVFYSDPLSEDVEGVDYDYTGYVNKDFLKDNVNLNSDFYLCGPPPFMKAVESILLELGVDNSKINYELFSN